MLLLHALITCLAAYILPPSPSCLAAYMLHLFPYFLALSCLRPSTFEFKCFYSLEFYRFCPCMPYEQLPQENVAIYWQLHWTVAMRHQYLQCISADGLFEISRTRYIVCMKLSLMSCIYHNLIHKMLRMTIQCNTTQQKDKALVWYKCPIRASGLYIFYDMKYS